MFFKLPWFKNKGPEYHDTQVLEMDFLVSEFEEAMDDIDDPMRNRLRAALVVCNTPKDLWFLRSKIFGLISKHHCEYEAHQRVAKLDQKLRFFCEHHPEYVIDDLPSGPMALLH